MRRRAEAEPLYRKTLDIMEWAYGPSHLDVASCLYNLGGCVGEAGLLASCWRQCHCWLEQGECISQESPAGVFIAMSIGCSFETHQGR